MARSADHANLPTKCNQVIERIEERAVVQANRTLARLGALFNWAVQKDLIAASPAAGVKPPTKESPRDRALTDDELRWLWAACGDIDWPFGPLVKLLVLTAQRRDEVAGMEWSDLDLTTRSWVIPRHKAKNNRTHVVHLSDAAMEVVCALPRVSDTLVFTTTGKTAVSGFSRAKRGIDLEMVEVRRRELLKDARHRSAIKLAAKGPLSGEIPEWNLHDLRRTAATGMARLSFPPHIVDKVLNHVSGTIRGVAAIYNRFEYLEERQAALSAWGLHIQNL
jgi:integrase